MPILDNFKTGASNIKEKINSSVEAKVTRKVTQSKNEIGILDPRVSPHRKCWLSDGKKTIVGVYGRGTSQEITEVWNSPYQNASLESATPQATAAYQIFTGGKTFVVRERANERDAGTDALRREGRGRGSHAPLAHA